MLVGFPANHVWHQGVNIPNWPTRWFLMMVYGLWLIEGFALSEKNCSRKILELKLCWVVRVGKCRTTGWFLKISVGDEKSKNPQFGDVGHLPHVPPPGGSKNSVAIGAAVSAKAQAFGPPVLLLAGDFWRNIGRVGQNTMVCWVL